MCWLDSRIGSITQHQAQETSNFLSSSSLKDVVAPALEPAGAKSNDDLYLSVAKPKRQTFYAITKTSLHRKSNVTGFSAVSIFARSSLSQSLISSTLKYRQESRINQSLTWAVCHWK